MNNFFKEYAKNRNAENQRNFRKRHPYYNSYMCYCRRRRKKGLKIDLSYEEWCNIKINEKKMNSR